MKIKYEFVNETIEIEVDDAIGEIVVAMERKEASNQRTIRNHEVALNTQNDYSTWLIAKEPGERNERDIEVENSFEELSQKQKELVDALYGPKPITAKEYAKKENVSPAAIAYRKKVIRKKLKKLL